MALVELETFYRNAGGLLSLRTGEYWEDDGAGFVLGQTKPNASNTGLVAPTTATSTGGTLNIDTPNSVYENIRFDRFVVVRTSGVRFYNCEFRGPASGLEAFNVNSRMLLTVTNDNAFDVVIERCRFRPQVHSDRYNSAVYGHDFTLLRCDLSGVQDLIGVNWGNDTNAANVAVLGCYLHDLAYHCPYSAQSNNYSHNDCIQLHQKSGHRNVLIHGNTFEAFIDTSSPDFEAPVWSGTPFDSTLQEGHPAYNADPDEIVLAELGFSCAGVMANINSGSLPATISNVEISKNWMNGGSNGAINVGSNWSGTNHSLRIVDNRWGRDFYQGAHHVMTKASGFHFTGDSELSGNVYEDDETPMNVGGCCGTWP